MTGKSSGVRPGFLFQAKGFSLIEVMMSIVLVAIGTALAIPSYQDQVEKRQLTNGAEQLAAFVNSVQGQAMRSNEQITISYSFTDSNTWCFGAIEGTDACDCTVTAANGEGFCAIDSTAFRMDDDIAPGRGLISQVTGDGAFTIDPVRGILDDTMEVDLQSRTAEFRLSLNINNSGRITLCSNGADYSVPGYELCPAEVTGFPVDEFPVIEDPVEGYPIEEVGS